MLVSVAVPVIINLSRGSCLLQFHIFSSLYKHPYQARAHVSQQIESF